MKGFVKRHWHNPPKKVGPGIRTIVKWTLRTVGKSGIHISLYIVFVIVSTNYDMIWTKITCSLFSLQYIFLKKLLYSTAWKGETWNKKQSMSGLLLDISPWHLDSMFSSSFLGKSRQRECSSSPWRLQCCTQDPPANHQRLDIRCVWNHILPNLTGAFDTCQTAEKNWAVLIWDSWGHDGRKCPTGEPNRGSWSPNGYHGFCILDMTSSKYGDGISFPPGFQSIIGNLSSSPSEKNIYHLKKTMKKLHKNYTLEV